KIDSIFQYRLPYTQWSAVSVFLIVIYIVLNLICVLWINPTAWALETRFGYLSAGNLLLIIVPAVRNSIISLVWGLPFDRIIVFHRFLGRFLLAVVTVHF